MRDVMQLSNVIRETGFQLHQYLGGGMLEKVYENGLTHRLRKQGLSVEQQKPLQIFDEDGALLGDYTCSSKIFSSSKSRQSGLIPTSTSPKFSAICEPPESNMAC
jgi:PD-(D/E)XK nuclease superfamily